MNHWILEVAEKLLSLSSDYYTNLRDPTNFGTVQLTSLVCGFLALDT